MVPVWEHIHFFVGFWQVHFGQEKQERDMALYKHHMQYCIYIYLYEQTLERPHERLHLNGEF